MPKNLKESLPERPGVFLGRITLMIRNKPFLEEQVKRLLTFALFALLALSLSAQTITVMNNGIVKYNPGEEEFRGAPGVIEKLVNDFMATHPGVRVNMIYRDVSKGSLTFDAMLAAGNPPDIWIDASGYHAAYLNDNYALRLNEYIDVSRFQPDLLSLYTKNGSVYALPLVNIATGMAVNLSMLERINYTLPPVEQWTTDEFLVLAARLKSAGIPATMIMGKGGFNSWTDVWFYAFGAQMFAPGDYSKVAINSPEARAALEYIYSLIARGYTPPPLTVNDDDSVEMFTTGKVFSGLMQNGHTDYWFPEQLRQGKIDEIPEYTFIEFPHAPGRAHTPVSGYQTILSAHKSNNAARNQLVAELAGLLTGAEAQWYYAVQSGGFPTYKNLAPNLGAAATPSYRAIAALAGTAGAYKEWPDGPKYVEVRRLWASLTEQWIRGRLTTGNLLSQFEREANAILR